METFANDIILVLVTILVVNLVDISAVLQVLALAVVIIYTIIKAYYLIKNKGK